MSGIFGWSYPPGCSGTHTSHGRSSSPEQVESLRVEMDKWEALAQAEAEYWTARDREEARIEAFDHRDRFRHEIEEAARYGDAEDL